MADITLKTINENLMALRGGLEKVGMDVKEVKLEVNRLKGKVGDLDNKVGALIVDTSDLKDEIKALQDEVVANTQINKRRIDEISEHVGLPTSG